MPCIQSTQRKRKKNITGELVLQAMPARPMHRNARSSRRRQRSGWDTERRTDVAVPARSRSPVLPRHADRRLALVSPTYFNSSSLRRPKPRSHSGPVYLLLHLPLSFFPFLRFRQTRSSPEHGRLCKCNNAGVLGRQALAARHRSGSSSIILSLALFGSRITSLAIYLFFRVVVCEHSVAL
jgi:hypothetical protein